MILSQHVAWLTGMPRRQILRALDSLTTIPTASQYTVVLHTMWNQIFEEQNLERSSYSKHESRSKLGWQSMHTETEIQR